MGDFCADATRSMPSLENFSLDAPGCALQPVLAAVADASTLAALRLGNCTTAVHMRMPLYHCSPHGNVWCHNF